MISPPAPFLACLDEFLREHRHLHPNLLPTFVEELLEMAEWWVQEGPPLPSVMADSRW